MPKTKISEFDVDPANNTDINSINIAEGCAPSGINNAIRQLMSDLKEQLTGASGDPFTVGGAFAANGGATLGDASGDALTINSSAVSIPNGLNFGSNNLVLSGGNVGIGTSSPSSFGKLAIANGSVVCANTSNGENELIKSVFSNGLYAAGVYTVNTFSSNLENRLTFKTTTAGGVTAEAMRIDGAGNVGIGTSSPASKLDVVTGTNSGLRVSDGTYTGTFVPSSLGGMAITTGGAYPLISYVNGAERMRIDSSGNLLVGASSFALSGKLSVYQSGTNNWCNQSLYVNYGHLFRATNTSGGFASYFETFNGSTYVVVGYISTTGSATSYVTSSDYRLKENIAPMTGALAKVTQLKPCTYTWKSDGSDGQGFIAHELAEVCPDAVTGEKDAVNEDGSIKPQGIDTSFLVATLTAAIQELKAVVDAQAERIAVLENK